MRSFFILALLGIVLITIALAVRSGSYGRSDPGQPINSAMREALNRNFLPERDAMVIAQQYPGARETPMGLRYLILEAGTGDATPREGQLISVHYDAWFLDGRPFDSSREKDLGPFNFRLGAGSVIPGWEQGLLTMKKGEKRKLIIPYWLAYGEKGIRGKIDPRATLIFDVELIDFR